MDTFSYENLRAVVIRAPFPSYNGYNLYGDKLVAPVNIKLTEDKRKAFEMDKA